MIHRSRILRSLLALLVGAALGAACDLPGVIDDAATPPASCPSGLDGFPHCPCRAVTHECVDPSTFCGPTMICIPAVRVR